MLFDRPLTAEQRRQLEIAHREIALMLEADSPRGLRRQANHLFLAAVRSAAHFGEWTAIAPAARLWIAAHLALTTSFIRRRRRQVVS